MRSSAFAILAVLAMAASSAQAQTSPDPLYGNDPHARAVLDCHADYARRYAKALSAAKATPTEVATAAYAHCIARIDEFAQATAVAARTKVIIDSEKYQVEQVDRLRDYAFAYAIDAYLKATAAF